MPPTSYLHALAIAQLEGLALGLGAVDLRDCQAHSPCLPLCSLPVGAFPSQGGGLGLQLGPHRPPDFAVFGCTVSDIPTSTKANAHMYKVGIVRRQWTVVMVELVGIEPTSGTRCSVALHA